MQNSCDTFAAVINLWENAAQYGRDIGISDVLARTHKKRNNIPSEYWVKVVEKAQERGFEHITYEKLAQIAATKPAHPDHQDEDAA